MDENEVIKHLIKYLQSNGWEIVSHVLAGQRGVDVVAIDVSGQRWHIEAKGGTSSNPLSARYGQPYTQAQVFDVTSKGLMQCLHRIAEDDSIRVALAYPDGRYFRRYIDPIKPSLSEIGISLFCIQENTRVQEMIVASRKK